MSDWGYRHTEQIRNDITQIPVQWLWTISGKLSVKLRLFDLINYIIGKQQSVSFEPIGTPLLRVNISILALFQLVTQTKLIGVWVSSPLILESSFFDTRYRAVLDNQQCAGECGHTKCNMDALTHVSSVCAREGRWQFRYVNRSYNKTIAINRFRFYETITVILRHDYADPLAWFTMVIVINNSLIDYGELRWQSLSEPSYLGLIAKYTNRQQRITTDSPISFPPFLSKFLGNNIDWFCSVEVYANCGANKIVVHHYQFINLYRSTLACHISDRSSWNTWRCDVSLSARWVDVLSWCCDRRFWRVAGCRSIFVAGNLQWFLRTMT